MGSDGIGKMQVHLFSRRRHADCQEQVRQQRRDSAGGGVAEKQSTRRQVQLWSHLGLRVPDDHGEPGGQGCAARLDGGAAGTVRREDDGQGTPWLYVCVEKIWWHGMLRG
jgi:hypothetical protein